MVVVTGRSRHSLDRIRKYSELEKSLMKRLQWNASCSTPIGGYNMIDQKSCSIVHLIEFGAQFEASNFPFCR